MHKPRHVKVATALFIEGQAHVTVPEDVVLTPNLIAQLKRQFLIALTEAPAERHTARSSGKPAICARRLANLWSQRQLQPLHTILTAEFDGNKAVLIMGENVTLEVHMFTELRRQFASALVLLERQQSEAAQKHVLVRRLIWISRLAPHRREVACVRGSHYADVYPRPYRTMNGYIHHGAQVVMVANDGKIALVKYMPVGEIFHPTTRGSRFLMNLETFRTWALAHQSHDAAIDCRAS